MPRLYLTPAELTELPIGIGLQGFISQLGANVLDKMLMRASQVCDTFCQRALGMPQSTTLSLAANAGDTAISITSTLTVDNNSDLAFTVGAGTTKETVMVSAGGVNTTSYVSPYPGTIRLASPLVYAHAQGEVAIGCYQEITEVDKTLDSNPFRNRSDLQNYGLALGYVPLESSYAYTVILSEYPINTITLIEYASGYSNTFQLITTTPQINPDIGCYRFGMTGWRWRDGLIRTTYTGGYVQVPDDIKIACSYYFAAQMEQIVNPFSAASTHMGKHSLNFSFKSKHTAAAEEILSSYVAII